MPRAMIWDSPGRNKYLNVRSYAWKMKLALMAAHDALLATQAKQTIQVNKKRRMCPLENRDLVYISTKNISYPKGTSRTLVPKFIGPYRITKDFGNNSYHIDLLDNLKQRGIHNVFHSSLLRIHIPNDDRLFPGRRDNQLEDLGGTNCEWAVDRILQHRGSHLDAEFEIQWTAGNKSWLPYREVSHLKALNDYFEAIGVTGIENLQRTGDKDLSDEDLQVSFGHSAPHVFGAHISCPSHQQKPTPHRPPQTHHTAGSHSTPSSWTQHSNLCPSQPPHCKAPQSRSRDRRRCHHDPITLTCAPSSTSTHPNNPVDLP